LSTIMLRGTRLLERDGYRMGIAVAYDVPPDTVPLQGAGPVAQLVIAIADDVEKPWVAKGTEVQLGDQVWRVTQVSAGAIDHDRTVVLDREDEFAARP